MEIKKFARKPFEVEAVQVTDDNILDVAQWCNGEVHTAQKSDSGAFIKVRVRYPLNERQTQAFVGDWVLSSRRGYKVYTDSALRTSFIDVEENDAPQELRTVDESSTRNVFDQDATSFGMSSVEDKDSITGKR